MTSEEACERLREMIAHALELNAAEDQGLGGPHVVDHFWSMAEFVMANSDLQAELSGVLAERVALLASKKPQPVAYEALAVVAHHTRWPDLLRAALELREQVPRGEVRFVNELVDAFADDWKHAWVYPRED